MLKNYLKIAFRNLIKNRVFVVINVLGLGIALACCIIAFLNWEYNAEFDQYHENTDDVYRVNFIREINGRSIPNGSCPFPLAEAIAQNITQVTETARYYPAGGNYKVGDQVFRTWMAAVDPAFVQIFKFELLEGSRQSLQDNSVLWIDEDLKKKYWPSKAEVVGESITYILGEQRHEFKIGAVFKKPPGNSSFGSSAYMSYDVYTQINNWDQNDWSDFNSTLIRVPNPQDVPAVEKQLQDYVGVQNRAKEDYKVARYYLDPFEGLAVRAERDGIYNHWFAQSLPTAAAVAPGIMSLLLLMIACFNFTNTSIAIANRRIKEIGVRKVMGSRKSQIIVQFLGENLLLTFLALLVGILVAAVLTPLYSAMWIFLDIRFNLFENIDLVLFLVGLLAFTAIIAGSYPALYISRFQPTSIFRGSVKFSGTNFFTRLLLTLQFTISLAAIICGFVFSQNAKYQEEYDMGFELESVLFAYVQDANGYRAYRNVLQADPRIKQIAGARNNLTSSWYTDPLKVREKEMDVSIFDISPEYLSAIGAKIIEGRDFRPNSEQDVRNSAIISQELAELLEWDESINQSFTLKDTTRLNVIGVVKDIYFDGSLFDPLDPMVLRAVNDDEFQFLVVKTDLEHVKDVKALMDEKWKTVFPDRLPSVYFMEQDRAESTEVNVNIKILFIFLGSVAVILSVIGLFSMVSMNINKKLKQIGIRKILGASTSNIAKRISREFVIILSISGLLGCAAGYYLANMLMASIWAYYTPIGASIFILALGTLITASVLTIGGKIFRAASVIPIKMINEQ